MNSGHELRNINVQICLALSVLSQSILLNFIEFLVKFEPDHTLLTSSEVPPSEDTPSEEPLGGP